MQFWSSMRNGFLLFVSIALGIYFLLNGFVAWRTWMMLSNAGEARWAAICGLVLLAATYPLSYYLESKKIAPWGKWCMWVGSFWLTCGMYLFLIFWALLFVDAGVWVSGAETWFRVQPQVWCGSVLFTCALLAYGHWNALHPRLVELNWKLDKLSAGSPPFKIVAASDIHSGTLVYRERVEKIVEQINAQKPDLILLIGDTIDADLDSVVRQNIGATLGKLHAPCGVYAVTGNHEYIGEVEPCVKYLQQNGIRFLRDQAVLIADRFYLVGREDASYRYAHEGKRNPLASLLKPLDRDKPVIVMDHQPRDIDEAIQCGVDAQLSGHTHDGQFWPINYITRAIFKVSHGFAQFDRTRVYVLSGTGAWGPQVRIGNHPEIAVVTLTSADSI